VTTPVPWALNTKKMHLWFCPPPGTLLGGAAKCSARPYLDLRGWLQTGNRKENAMTDGKKELKEEI